MVVCAECRHHRFWPDFYVTGAVGHICIENATSMQIDPVTGQPTKLAAPLKCQDRRANTGDSCGPCGRMFEWDNRF
jgi:hypothetical protein